MKAKWIYENNTFLILATRSQKRFYKFMFSFMQALYAEHTIADINTIYTTALPAYTAYKNGYIYWKAQYGIRKGDTFAQNELFKLMSTEKVPDWHRDIQVIYKPKSAEYKKIFPNGITAFSKGAMEERLAYFALVIKNGKLFSTLDTITDEMDLFYADVDTSRTTKLQSGSGVKINAEQLKTLASKAAVETFGALGSLMKYHKANPENIKKYFNLTLLRYTKKNTGDPSDMLELLFLPEEIKEGGFSFTPSMKLMVYNSGDTTLRCWFVPNKTDDMPSNYFDLTNDEVKEFVVGTYANEDDRFFMIKNLSTTEDGALEIEEIL